MRTKLIFVTALLVCFIACSKEISNTGNISITKDLIPEIAEFKGQEKRYALVIGNASYEHKPLKNPVNDAPDIADALKSAGFEVMLGVNLRKREMEELIRKFGEKIKSGGVGLFYFSGHGVQTLEHKNYLIPIGYSIAKAEDIEYEAVDAGRVLAEMQHAQNAMNIIILDACRNNPFGNTTNKALGDNKGLAEISNVPKGTLIMYATAPGKVADDNPSGRNGLFTQELLKYIKIPGVEVGKLVRLTRDSVATASNNAQIPWEASSLPANDFYFLPPSNNSSNANGSPINVPINNAPIVATANAPVAGSLMPPDPLVDKRMTGELGYVPAGRFIMGSDNGDADEKPVHEVEIKEGFYLGKYEVTQEQWEAVMGNNPSYFTGDKRLPVENVSWNDIQEFMRRLNSKSSQYIYRLPSEAEWEYAARAGTTGDYAGELDLMGWYYNNSGGKTHIVGQKQPNAYGLYDMHGNVWEWCQDSWHDSYNNAPKDGRVWETEADNSLRVLRGGSWDNLAVYCRSACRLWYAPGARYYLIGFRVVASARTLK